MSKILQTNDTVKFKVNGKKFKGTVKGTYISIEEGNDRPFRALGLNSEDEKLSFASYVYGVPSDHGCWPEPSDNHLVALTKMVKLFKDPKQTKKVLKKWKKTPRSTFKKTYRHSRKKNVAKFFRLHPNSFGCQHNHVVAVSDIILKEKKKYQKAKVDAYFRKNRGTYYSEVRKIASLLVTGKRKEKKEKIKSLIKRNRVSASHSGCLKILARILLRK